MIHEKTTRKRQENRSMKIENRTPHQDGFYMPGEFEPQDKGQVELYLRWLEKNERVEGEESPVALILCAEKSQETIELMQLDHGNIHVGQYMTKMPPKELLEQKLARAIMKDAPIVILDEATANVDPENEKDLMDAVDALTKEKTIIMIAHRLKTVRHADQIVVVEKGRIAQQGTHEQLMKQEGIYKRFVDARQQAVSWKLVH